uniref:Uncharacterized protein n=1 Tax=Lutzomyia longipalpis TaxID=7200 RepID=A0A1B0CX71_LUTLO
MQNVQTRETLLGQVHDESSFPGVQTVFVDFVSCASRSSGEWTTSETANKTPRINLLLQDPDSMVMK